MKQIEKTSKIRDLLTASVGEGVDLDALRVYEAIAFNTLPIRKEHTLYKGARADRNFLLEMARRVAGESVPVQIQHNKEPLPIGRVFHGEVVDQGVESELRVLFFLDPTANEQATKIEAGSVDQVSVSVMSKQLLNSVSGFDYLGPDASYENHWSGDDGKGNVLGKNGVYAQMRGLNTWFEMSLVGQGGATNARIVARDKSHFGDAYERLAASGMNPSALVLNASPTKEQAMDFSALITDISAKSTEIANLNLQVTTLTAASEAAAAELAAAQTRVTELEAQVAGQADVAALTASRDEAMAALSAVAQKVLTKAGKVNEQLPAEVAALSALIEENAAVLVIAPNGNAKESVTDLTVAPTPRASAFRSAR